MIRPIIARFAESRIIVIGKDLPEITQDTPYARLVILHVDPVTINSDQDSEKVFRFLQKLDFIKYHVFAKGFMIRVSSENFREQARVSKAALQEGITFEKLGNALLSHYTDVAGVKAATVVFITDPSIDYEQLINDAKKVREITHAFSKILEGMPTDCGLCKLKPVCDEVEGMRQLHFQKEENRQ